MSKIWKDLLACPDQRADFLGTLPHLGLPKEHSDAVALYIDWDGPHSELLKKLDMKGPRLSALNDTAYRRYRCFNEGPANPWQASRMGYPHPKSPTKSL